MHKQRSLSFAAIPHALIGAAFLGAIALLGLPGCGSAMIAAKEAVGIPKRDQMVARVKDARDSQNDAKEQFQSALDEFLAVTKVSGSDLEARYKKLTREYEASEDSAKKVNSRIADVERVATALFAEWQKEIGEYNSESMKSAAQQQLTQTKTKYNGLLTSMKSAAGKMAKPLGNFHDQVLFLKGNLNARAIAGLQGTAAEISSDVEKLIREMNISIDEANAFISSMQPAK